MSVAVSPVVFGPTPLSLESVIALAERRAESALDADPQWRARIDRGAAVVDGLLDREGQIYGITTGYGDSCVTAIPLSQVEALPRQLYTFHGCGLGRFLEP